MTHMRFGFRVWGFDNVEASTCLLRMCHVVYRSVWVGSFNRRGYNVKELLGMFALRKQSYRPE